MNNERTPVRIFDDMPVEKLKGGYYSDKYFNRTGDVLARDNHNPIVKYQVFQKRDAVLGGIDEAVAIIKKCTGDDVIIRALHSGDHISPKEVVLTIEGPVQSLVRIETAYLGVMARGTGVATNVWKTVQAANHKPVLFFAARFDHYRVQTPDGFAAFRSGATGVSTDANAWWQVGQGIGTMPHAMIAAYGGDTVQASLKFDEFIEDDVNRIPLVDWDNDCIGTSIAIVKAFQERAEAFPHDFDQFIGTGKGKVYGVRFDTSGNMRDASVSPMSKELSLGVTPILVDTARKTFDKLGYTDLKIAVSGGFNPEKITLFETMGVPVDIYGVGNSIYDNLSKFSFTSDIVVVDGELCAKEGRGDWPNERLQLVD